MKNKVIAVVGALALLLAYKFFTADSPEGIIKDRLEQFRVAALEPIGLVGLNRLTRVKGLERYFMKDLKVIARNGKFVLNGRSDLSRLAQAGYSRAPKVDLSFKDLSLEFLDDETVNLHLTVLVEGKELDSRWEQAQEFVIIMKKDSGDWLFARIELIEALSLE